MIIAKLNPEEAEMKKKILALGISQCTPEQTMDDFEWVCAFYVALTPFLIWHPDSSFDEYTHNQTNEERIFDDTEAAILNFAMARSMKICARFYDDPYTLGLYISQSGS